MNYKLISSYVIASIILDALTIPIAFLLNIFVGGIRLSSSPIDYLKVGLESALAGAVIGLIISLLGNERINGWIQVGVCLLTCLIFANLLTIKFESSLEGVWVWFSILGLIFGLLVFFVQKLIYKMR
jgi:hypothetical protein